MAKTRKRAGRIPHPSTAFSKYLQGIRDYERRAKAAVGSLQAERKNYERLVRSLAKEARRQGWRSTLHIESDGNHGDMADLCTQPERLLATTRAWHLPTWYFPDPIICATLGCALMYVRKDGAICVTVGCWVSGSKRVCAVICFTPENPA